ncbi:hypothetical protein BASA81_010234 [Batrachochytrium salamandrivorans]|nr:hypothetical protein BASA81_010234 [Batrachochytrium salamandrivorans]
MPISSDQRRALGQFSSGIATRIRMEQADVQSVAWLELPQEWRDRVPDEDKARRLLGWFKNEYFQWVNQPACRHCQSPATKCTGTRSGITSQEIKGMVSVVEVYTCDECSMVTDFPRFNHPVTLFETRRGRCGEFANAFCALAVASGFNTRYVVDLTDHVWAELLVDKRWVHCDPCENAYDTPLLYESGWNKQLSFCFAFERAGKAVDVSRRYSRKWDGPMIVRRYKLCSVDLLHAVQRARPAVLMESEQNEFSECVSQATRLVQRIKPGEELGRISGNRAWKQARGELGKAPRSPPKGKIEFQTRYRALLAQGLTPNQAAAQALREELDRKKE